MNVLLLNHDSRDLYDTNYTNYIWHVNLGLGFFLLKEAFFLVIFALFLDMSNNYVFQTVYFTVIPYI